MTDRDRLIKLLIDSSRYIDEQRGEAIADHLLANGVIVAPMPMAEWLKKELTEYVHQRCMEEL